MSYRVFWKIPQQILCLELEGNVSLDDLNNVNHTVIDQLGDEIINRHVGLVVDITRPGRITPSIAQLKATQTYVIRHDLKFIMVAGTDKLMRLMMMLTFNLCRPSLRFFDTLDLALTFANRSMSGEHPVSIALHTK